MKSPSRVPMTKLKDLTKSKSIDFTNCFAVRELLIHPVIRVPLDTSLSYDAISDSSVSKLVRKAILLVLELTPSQDVPVLSLSLIHI